MWFCVARAGCLVLCQKRAKCEGLATVSKALAGVGHFKQDLQRCMSRGKRCARNMLTRDVRSSGRRFPEMDCNLEHQIFRFAKMMLRDRCSTGNDLVSLFVANAISYTDGME